MKEIINKVFSCLSFFSFDSGYFSNKLFAKSEVLPWFYYHVKQGKKWTTFFQYEINERQLLQKLLILKNGFV